MLLPPLDKRSVNQSDAFLVIKQIDQFDWRVVESQPTLETAKKAAKILQDHASQFGGVQKYDVREMGAYTCSR